MPAPNFFAGILCAIANSSFVAVLMACLLWGVAWVVLQAILGFPRLPRIMATGEQVPMTKLVVSEFLTASLTAIFSGSIAYGVKYLFF